MKTLIVVLIVGAVFVEIIAACTPTPPPSETTTPSNNGSTNKTGGRKRRSPDASVTILTELSFDPSTNDANVKNIGLQIKQLAQQQGVNPGAYGPVSKSVINSNGKLAVRYSFTQNTVSCDSILGFVSNAVQVSGEITAAEINCDGETYNV